MLRRVLTLAGLLAVGLPLLGQVQPEKKPAVVMEKDLVYGKGGDQDLQLDLARPKEGDGPFPCIVCVHGGGWRAGNRQQLGKLIETFAQQGYVAVTISYRLAPAHKFPAQIEDCKAAVRWLRANAKKLKINPDRMGAIGFSAGGHLVSLLGAADDKAGLEGKGGHPEQSSRVQAVVNFFGPTDFITKTWNQNVEEVYLIPFLGDNFEKGREKYRQASPLHYVSKDDPPFLFLHGDKDELVQIHHSQVMNKKLQEVGVKSRLVVMEGEGHGWAGAKLQQSLDETLKFFAEHLKK